MKTITHTRDAEQPSTPPSQLAPSPATPRPTVLTREPPTDQSLIQRIAALERQLAGGEPAATADPYLQRLREISAKRVEVEARCRGVVERYASARVPLEEQRSAKLVALREAEAAWTASEIRKQYVNAQNEAAIANDALDALRRAEAAELDALCVQLARLNFELRPSGDPSNWGIASWHMPSEPTSARAPERETEWVSTVRVPMP